LFLNLKIIIGSTRPGRVCPTIAAWVAQSATAHGKFNVEVVDLAEVNLPFLDEPHHPITQNYQFEHTKKWASIVADGDAFIFVTPEYDFFPAAVTVNAIQVLMKEWAYKCAGVVSYGGISGGLRSAQALRQLISNVNVHAIPQTVPLPMVFPHIVDGVFTPTQPMVDGMSLQLNELTKWATALKTIRA
jgi:NAD(P)H-dependent FMN reductase